MNSSTTVETPAGPFTIVVGPSGAVRGAGFTSDVAAVLAVIHPSLRGPVREHRELGGVTDAVRAYFDGELTAIDAVPVEQHADGAFLSEAWRALRDIKAGAPVSYAAFAARTGRPTAIRAAAAACARNAVALFVPCHRVIRSDGSLGGYRWGLAAKRWLLDHEQRERALTSGPTEDRVV